MTKTNVICGWWRCTARRVKATNPLLRWHCKIKIQPYRKFKEVDNACLCVPSIHLHDYFSIDADRARKHGMEDFISADPCQFDHAALFKLLQNLTLEYRLNDPYCSLVKTPKIRQTDRSYVLLLLGVVQPWSSVCSRWVLCEIRSAGMLQTFMLFIWLVR